MTAPITQADIVDLVHLAERGEAALYDAGFVATNEQHMKALARIDATNEALHKLLHKLYRDSLDVIDGQPVKSCLDDVPGSFTVETIKTPRPIELDGKRCYLPYKLSSKCPKCGVLVSIDLTERPLNYPDVNGEEKIDFYHKDADDGGPCSYEWPVYFRFVVTLEPIA